MSTHQVLLLLGSGANVGAHVVRKFAANGFKVASASRTAQVQDRVDLHVQCDLSDPDSVIEVFNEVTRTLGPPSVVVYNGMKRKKVVHNINANKVTLEAAAATLNSAEDPLSLDVKTLNRDFQINTASVLVAAREATKAFDNLPPTASRTFIYTGNILNASPMAPLLGLGIGKSATAHLIASASMAYKLKGYK